MWLASCCLVYFIPNPYTTSVKLMYLSLWVHRPWEMFLGSYHMGGDFPLVSLVQLFPLELGHTFHFSP